MCGIAGIWGESNEPLIRAMTDRIAHRGPDDWDIKVFADATQAVSLGHRRLSIIDLSAAGRQPMTNEDETLWVVFNGEIYNFPTLREQLLQSGHVFRSKSDTEVLLHGYEEWGLDFVKKLNGIFAFAIWDKERRLLHLGRDRYGVKPLYYWMDGSRVLFGSEIKSFLCDPRFDLEIDFDALLPYLKFRYCPEPLTLFKQVRRVPPGHTATFGGPSASVQCFYELAFDNQDWVQGSEKALASQLRELLFETVKRQMISDVPVGVFLSGGVDSSGLLSIASRFAQEPMKTYTIGFRAEDQRNEGQPGDIEYARDLARACRTDHQEIILEPKIVDLLPKIIWHLDDPIADPAAITSFLISRAARERGTKVLLSGQGGDEVFCGYPWHLAAQLSRWCDHLPKGARKFVESSLNHLPAAKGGALGATFRRLRKINASAWLPFEDRLIGFLSYAYAGNLHGLLGDRFRAQIDQGVAERSHREFLQKSANWHYINRMLHLDMGTFLPALNLAYTDKTSMAFGVEVRVPYIDNEVVDFMARIPPELKMRGTTRKHLMKLALQGVVPDAILHRKKAGFGAPIRTWIVSDLREMVADLLSEASLRRRGVFDPAYVRRLIEENASGRNDYSYLIYILLNFELWCQVCLDGRIP